MNHISITTLEAPELDIYARLSEGQLFHYNEPKEGLFIAESPKVIGRALDAGYEPVSFLMEERHIETEGREILERPVCAGVPVFTAPFDVLTRLTGFKLTRGMLCAVKRKKMPGIEEICAGARRIAILENVENPTNVGAIFRSAAALFMDAVLLTPDAVTRCTAVQAVSVWEQCFRCRGRTFRRATGRRTVWKRLRSWDFARRRWRSVTVP